MNETALHTFRERPAKRHKKIQIQGTMEKLFEHDDQKGWWKTLRFIEWSYVNRP